VQVHAPLGPVPVGDESRVGQVDRFLAPVDDILMDKGDGNIDGDGKSKPILRRSRAALTRRRRPIDQ
jgi:hypothetical protein